MTCSPLYGDFPKNNKKTAPHARLKIEDIVESYRQRMVTAKGLILLILKAARRPTKRYRILNVSRFCEQLDISRSTFYKSIKSLKESGDIGVEDKSDELFLWWINKNAPQKETTDKKTTDEKVVDNTVSVVSNPDVAPVSTESTPEYTVSPNEYTVSPNEEFQQPEPLQGEDSEDSPTINTTINTTTEDLNKKTRTRENFENLEEPVISLAQPTKEFPAEKPKPIEDPYFGRGNWHKQIQQEFKASAPANQNRPLKRWELAIGVPETAFVKFIANLGKAKFDWDDDCAEGFALSYINKPDKSQQMEAHYDAFLRKMDEAVDTANTCLSNGMTPVLPPELTIKPVPDKAEVVRKLNLVQSSMAAISSGNSTIELPSLKEVGSKTNEKSENIDWAEKTKAEWIPMFAKNFKVAERTCSAILKNYVPAEAKKDVLQAFYENESTRDFALKKAKEQGVEFADILGW